jgi:hypothetical protein
MVVSEQQQQQLTQNATIDRAGLFVRLQVVMLRPNVNHKNLKMTFDLGGLGNLGGCIRQFQSSSSMQ